METDSEKRKGLPVATGFVDYFPDAMVAVSALSLYANEKHNPGEPLHWSKEKSADHADCIMRHFLERNEFDPDDGFLHLVKVAWRAMAALQTHLDGGGEYRKVEEKPPAFTFQTLPGHLQVYPPQNNWWEYRINNYGNTVGGTAW